MEIEIIDNDFTIQLITNGHERLILKTQVRDVNLVGATIIRIDLGNGPRGCIYIDYNNVTVPQEETVQDLRKKILSMLQATESIPPL